MRQVQSRESLAEFLDALGAMGGAVVEDYHQGFPEMAEGVVKKLRDGGLVDIAPTECPDEAQAVDLRTDSDARNDRDAVVAKPVVNDRRLSNGSPGFPYRGSEHKSRLVNEYQPGAQPSGVFFTRGHWRDFHSSIAISLRSNARRSGF